MILKSTVLPSVFTTVKEDIAVFQFKNQNQIYNVDPI